MQISEHVHALRVPFRIPMPDGRSVERFVFAYSVVAERRAVLVDAGVRGYCEALRAALESSGVALDGVVLTLLTHAHPDHIGGLAGVVAATRCETAAHADAVPWIEDTERQCRERPVPGFAHLVEGPVRVVRRLAAGDEVGGDGLPRMDVIETPGHAAGHLALHYPADGVLFCGDALPQPGAMPIYDDVVASVASIRCLQPLAAKTRVLLSSWDEPCPGAEIPVRLQAALDAIQAVHEAVREESARAGTQMQVLLPAIVRRLALPPFAVNPLTARTIAAHLRLVSEARVI